MKKAAPKKAVLKSSCPKKKAPVQKVKSPAPVAEPVVVERIEEVFYTPEETIVVETIVTMDDENNDAEEVIGEADADTNDDDEPAM